MTWTRAGGTKNSSGGGVTSLTKVSPIAVSVGDTIMCSVTWDTSGGATSASITDNLGNVWAAGSASKNLGALNNQAIQVLACIVTNAGTPTLTLKFNPTPGTTSAGGIEWLIDIYTGSTPTAAIDGTGANNEQTAPGTSTDAITSGSFTTSNDGCLVYSATVSESSGGGTQTHGTGYALAQSDANVLVFNSEHKTQTTHGSIAATWTTNAGSDNFVTVAIAVAPSTGSNVTVNPTGISASTSIGAPTVLRSGVKVSPIGFSLTASEGTPVVNIAGSTIHPVGIVANASLGSPTVLTLVKANPAGFLVTTGLGTFLTESDTTLLGNFGLLATTSRGTSTVNINNGTGADITINPIGFSANTSIGLPQLHVDNNFTVNGLVATVSLGQPSFSVLDITPTGLLVSTFIGSPSLIISAATLTPHGLVATTSLGAPRTFFGAGGNNIRRGFLGVGVGV